MAEPRISAFTSERARTAFLAAYARAMDRLWPVERTPLDVPTAFGTTRVYRSGRADGVPVVLLPGAGGNALTWYRYVARLGRTHPVIAVDPVGEPGASDQSAPIGDGRDLARWLDGVLDALDVRRAHVVGCSYGGWVGLQHALHAPGRTATITLLDPAGLGRIGGRFLLWVIAGGLAALTPAPARRRLARWLHNATLLDGELMRLAGATMRFRRRLPVPPPLSDDDWRRVEAPALVLLGERSQMYDAGVVAARLRDLLPAAHVEVVPGASHDLPVHSPDLVVERTIEFIGQAGALA
ncbi:alpha/beta fold hydrolase [Micromonospora costi]|uniref:alpha/beta fold hydrolase n=1 Tax=Micromonospora costi TaxID=1530042 RepID=UPI00340DA89D